VAEEEAVYSAIEAGAMPGKVLYRFRCTTCGDAFTLDADMRSGAGSWTREGGGAA
jgi:predicted nucleic acid-binding Zn ribbon protein